MAAQQTFFTNLCESMRNLIAHIIGADQGSLFQLLKKLPQVHLGQNASANARDFSLYFQGHRLGATDSGTFAVEQEVDFLVFREPVRFAATFRLQNHSGWTEEVIQIYDKLTNYFFNQRSIEPFLPESIKAYPALYQKLQAQRASVSLLPAEPARSDTAFDLGMEYSALYHSGTPLRTEKRVTDRIVSIHQSLEKGSVL